MPDATILLLASQVSNVLKFFLYKNIRIARDRAWDQTVLSRGKGPDFWGPYVEEWAIPPAIGRGSWTWEKWVGGWFGRMVIMRGVCPIPWSKLIQANTSFEGVLLPLNFYPFIGIAVGAYFKAVGTARYLHKQVSHEPVILRLQLMEFPKYFAAKKMTEPQVAVFMEERRWYYRGEPETR